ncbi:hypothetical protein H0H92_012022 [Tricholoma furcatifolium]|nr:hypothetical protein H0H92_012022 [Tricholoma furcatifolium]
MGMNTQFSTYIKPDLLDNLPVDLKREILETAAYIYPSFALRLAVVSREVQPWAERIIYRELYFNGRYYYRGVDGKDKAPSIQQFKVPLESRHPSFFAEYVRSLHFDGACSADEVLPIMRVCTGVTNFGLYASINAPADSAGSAAFEIARIVHGMPLQTLFISNKSLEVLLMLDVLASRPSGADNNHNDEESKDVEEDEDEDEETAARAPLTSSCLQTLPRLGLVDGYEYPVHRFPALTHLALIPDYDEGVTEHVQTALAQPRMQSLVIMLNYVNAPRQSKTTRALRNIGDSRLVLFTLPGTHKRYIEDDLWDLANEFPDPEPQLTYLNEIPGPRLLSFQEMMDLYGP